MGSLLVYRCAHCGASKATDKLHFMILCDYCGGLVGFDDFGFARSDHYQKLAAKMQTDAVRPGTIPNRLQQLFYQEMEDARRNGSRKVWLAKAEEYYRLYYNYYYQDFLKEYCGDPMFQIENIVRTILLWYDVSFFDKRMMKCWREYEEAWNEFQSHPGQDSAAQAQRLVTLYTAVLEKLYEIISPADLGVNCQAQDMVRGSLIRWFQQLVIDEGLPAPMRQAITARYQALAEDLGNPQEKSVPSQGEVIGIDCTSCGAHFTFPAEDGVYPCPNCRTSFRFLKKEAIVTPQEKSS
jgi:DNA-directed RNA polymerase subunit RPC12/RpoP